MSISPPASATLEVIYQCKTLGGSDSGKNPLQIITSEPRSSLIYTRIVVRVWEANMIGPEDSESTPKRVALKVVRTSKVIANPVLRHEACVLLRLQGDQSTYFLLSAKSC